MFDLVSTLHCPCCGIGFSLENITQLKESQYGVMQCACYRYPIIEGIPVLLRRSGPADTRDDAVKKIDAGDFEGALKITLDKTAVIRKQNYGWRHKLQKAVDRLPVVKQFVLNHSRAQAKTKKGQGGITLGSKGFAGAHPMQTGFRDALGRLKTVTYADYLYQRYANSSFLSAFPLIGLLQLLSNSNSKPRILDLACGVGHSTFLISTMYPHNQVIAVDHDLDNLLIAKNYLAPNATFICADAELPLPFATNWFDAVFCMDAFHYVRSKVALIKELNRIVSDTGIWLFPHLHNASGTNTAPGIPMTAPDYLRCFDLIPSQLMPESVVLSEFVDNGGLNLSRPYDQSALIKADVFCMVASRQEGIWRHHQGIDCTMLDRVSEYLKINPIYEIESGNGKIGLEFRWPNARLKDECGPAVNFMPEKCSIPLELLEIPQDGESRRKILDLIRTFVLVPLQKGYRIQDIG